MLDAFTRCRTLSLRALVHHPDGSVLRVLTHCIPTKLIVQSNVDLIATGGACYPIASYSPDPDVLVGIEVWHLYVQRCVAFLPNPAQAVKQSLHERFINS